jgi:hypothetical protein
VDLPSEDITESGDAVLSGWGVTSTPTGYFSDKLQNVTVKILERTECTNDFPHPICIDQICTYVPEKGAATVSIS